jgi:hypothetical protein
MLGEPDTFGGQAIYVGRADFPLTEAAQVGVAQVIGENKNNVRFRRNGRRGEGRGPNANQSQQNAGNR